MRAFVYPPEFIVAEDEDERGGDWYPRNVMIYASGAHGEYRYDCRITDATEYLQFVFSDVEVGG